MRKLITFYQAARLSLILFGLIMLFHLAVIIGIVLLDYVPMDFLWGGRMESRGQLLGFEILSLLVTLLCFLAVLIRAERIPIPALMGVSRVILWILFFLFVVNTIGNLVAKTTFEKVFSLVTAVLSLLCLRLALEPTNRESPRH